MDHRYQSMDFLRAVAILLVILAHTVLSYGAPAYLAPLQYGGTGVDLFFVLSGWLLGCQLFKEAQNTSTINVKRFWVRRWMRTLPAYYVVLLFSVAQRLLTKENVEFPFSYFIFTQNYFYPLEFFSISWSLCVEEQFYLVVAPLILLLMRTPKLVSSLTLITLLLLPLLFRQLELFNNSKENKAYNDDVFNLLDTVTADIIYLDPPYTGTMNNYFSFYGLIDDFITSKKTKPFENNFTNKKNVVELFDDLFSKLSNFKYWYLSYNNSSYPSKDELLYLLNKYSDNVQVIERKHVYKITGKEKKETNKEYLFIVKNQLSQKNIKKDYVTAEL